MTYVLEVQNIRSGYGDTRILDDVSFRVEPGETYALLGKNGVGKTTLIRTLIGLQKVWSGSIHISGQQVNDWRSDQIVRAFKVSYAPQEKAFFSDLTIDQNLRLGSLTLTAKRYMERRDIVIAYFPFLADRLGQRAGSLSGGEQSMLKVARAILNEPEIVLLDEVSDGLQPLAVDRMRSCLLAEQKRGMTIVLVEQNLGFIRGLATRYGLVGAGRIVASGSMTDVDADAAIARHLAI